MKKAPANVAYKRKELATAQQLYDVIRDCIAGEVTVKSKTTTYLPIPNDDSDTGSKSTRYDSYVKRAVFYNVTKRTIDGFVGQIFMRDPVLTLPDQLDFMKTNADGAGVNIVQLANRATRHVVAYGRAGVLVDYPATKGPVTRAMIDSGDLNPILSLYDPYAILNWRTVVRGSRELLSLVVLQESYIEEDDGFEAVERKQYRVLQLNEQNQYTVTLYRDNGAGERLALETITPKDANGNPFTEIPFFFIGAENNDSTIDEPPMYDIASLNIAHYRNSADYEESVFLVGQPTPVFTGLSEDWVKNVLKGRVFLGSRGSISLPVGADAKLLQASENSMPLEAMQHKEKQMVALGARVVEKRAVVRTASEASIDHNTESSVLASVAKNVSSALTTALIYAGRFAGTADAEIAFTLNTDFDIASMSSEERRQLIEEWQAGAVAWEELRQNLRKSGIAYLDDATARSTIDQELADIPAIALATSKQNGAKTK